MVETACPPYDDPKHAMCNVQLHELVQSRTHEVTPRGDVWTLEFVVLNTTSLEEVEARLEVNRYMKNTGQPIEWPGIGIYQIFGGQPLRDYRIQRVGHTVWMVEAVYGYKGLQVMPGRQWQGADGLWPANIQATTIGGSKHITKNRWTVTWSSGAPDMHGAIEWDGTAVKGIDVPAAAGRWREVWKFSMKDVFSTVTPWPGPPTVPGAFLKYKDTGTDYWKLSGLSLFQRWHKMVGWVHGYDWWLNVDGGDAGKCNTGWDGSGARGMRFRGFEQGSIMFLGAEVTQLDDWTCEVTFEFQYEPNRWEMIPSTIANPDDVPVERDCSSSSSDYEGPEIVIRGADNVQQSNRHEIYVNGFDYFQVYYENSDTVDADTEEELDDGTIVIPKATAYFIHQTTTYCPFGWLGIPIHDVWSVNKESSAQHVQWVSGAEPKELSAIEREQCIE